MKKNQLPPLTAGLILLAQSVLSQNVKLAKIALGMNEAEVKTALVSSAPFYINQPSDYPDMLYLVAEDETESYAFTLIDGKVAAFSVMHILPPGQLPFLPPGQQPTVSFLRNLITRQTWAPAEINKGETHCGSVTRPERLSPMLCNAAQSQAKHGCPLGRCRVQSRPSPQRDRRRAS